MKKILLILLAMAFTAAGSIAIFDHFRATDPESPPNVVAERLHSVILAQERDLIIHLPEDYDSTKKYPVIYVLDGSSQDCHIANTFEVLSSAGLVPRTIVVGIPNMSGENRQLQLVPPFMKVDHEKADSPPGQGDRFLAFMESEVFTFMEENYSASHTRLLSGHSRGGLLVLYSLLSKPSLFSARFCFSAPMWRENDLLIGRVNEFLSQQDSLQSFLYLSAGENETDNIKGGLERLKKNLQASAPTGLTWYCDFTPKAVHQDNPERSASAAFVRWGDYFSGNR